MRGRLTTAPFGMSWLSVGTHFLRVSVLFTEVRLPMAEGNTVISLREEKTLEDEQEDRLIAHQEALRFRYLTAGWFRSC